MTDKQFSVAKGLAESQPIKAIAHDQRVTSHAVYQIVMSIKRKFDIKQRGSAAAAVLTRALVKWGLVQLALVACLASAQPELPVVAPSTKGQIALRWDGSGTNFLVSVRDSLDGQPIQTVATATNGIIIRGLESGRAYWNNVVSQADGTNSLPSNTVRAIATPPGSGPPLTVFVSQVTVSYESLSDATNVLQRADSIAGPWTDVAAKYHTNNSTVTLVVPNNGKDAMFRVKVSE